MKIFTATIGRGRNSDRRWAAADTIEEAKEILANGQEARGLAFVRDVRPDDQVTKSCRIYFCGSASRLLDKHAVEMPQH